MGRRAGRCGVEGKKGGWGGCREAGGKDRRGRWACAQMREQTGGMGRRVAGETEGGQRDRQMQVDRDPDGGGTRGTDDFTPALGGPLEGRRRL